MGAAAPPVPARPPSTLPPLDAAALRAGRRGPAIELVAWGFYLVAVLVMMAGVGGRQTSLAYVAVSLVSGLMLYTRSPAGYVSFSLWLWFLTPFIRRVLDMHHGWSPASPALIAPQAVALMSVFTVLRQLKELRGHLYAPYLLVLSAFVYGYVVGVINAGLLPATYALVTWMAPAFFGLHIALSWRRFPELGAAVRRTFAIALPLLAAYGIYQFVKMPRWDAMWMLNADLRSIGAPRPFLARVFGTLNTPGPYAAFLCAGALLLLPQKGRLRFVGIGLGMVSLLLARTRAVWVAFIIGLVVQQFGQPLRRMPKHFFTLVLVSLVALPIVSMPQFSALIAPRLASLGNLSQDNSFIKRYNFSEQAAQTIVETAEGNGLGTTGGAIKLRGGRGLQSLDNGFLEVFYIYGWPGGMVFFLGIGGVMLQSMRFRETKIDPFANSMRSIAIALVSILPIGDVFTGPTGTLLWMGVGFGISGHAYYLTTGRALRSQAWVEATKRAMQGAAAPPPAGPVPALALSAPAAPPARR